MAWHNLQDLRRFLPAAGAILRSQLALGGRRHEHFVEVLQKRAAHTPSRIALRFEAETLNYGEFNAGANAFASVFKQAGIGREPIALVMENGPTLLMAQAGAAKIGAVAALISTHLSGAPLSQALRFSEARHVFTDAACLPRAAAPPESASLTLWGQGDPAQLPPHIEPLDAALASASRANPPDIGVRADDPFLYLFTSGTTGPTRPTIVRHQRFALAGEVVGALLGLSADDVVYAPLPLYHGIGNLLAFSTTLATGAVLATRRRFRADAVIDDVRHHRATVLVYAGEMCRHLLCNRERPEDRDHSLRIATGAGLRPDIWERLQRRFAIPRIVEWYGLSEGNVTLVNLAGKIGSVGRAFPTQGGHLRLARCDLETGALLHDDNGFVVGCHTGEVGELLSKVVDGALMPYEGFIDRKAREARLVHDCFRRGDTYFRTGDLLRVAPDGYYEFVDRLGDAFRCNGEDVFTQTTAEVLHGASGIIEANVYGVATSGGMAPMAAVVLAGDTSFDGAALYATALRLPQHARPLAVRVVAAMDATGTLKQRKADLRSQGFDPSRVTDRLYVRDDTARSYVPLTVELAARLRRPSEAAA